MADRNSRYNAGWNNYYNYYFRKAYAVDKEEEEKYNNNVQDSREGNYYVNKELDYKEPSYKETEDYFGTAALSSTT